MLPLAEGKSSAKLNPAKATLLAFENSAVPLPMPM